MLYNDYVHYLSQFELEESGEWVIDIEIESEKGKSLTILDFIVSDHHKQQDKLPNAYAILNPNQHDCTYPFKGLCGAGVAFKLCLGINTALDNNIDKGCTLSFNLFKLIIADSFDASTPNPYNVSVG